MSAWCEPYEISLRFRQSVQARIDRLEENANSDESIIPTLLSEDHRRRQLKLVEAQRYEATRMRELLSYTRLRNSGYKSVS
jgi:hypothetical protein